MPLFRLTFEKTYYRQGFFNVTVDFDRFIRPTEGPVELVLGTSGLEVEGKVNRRANQNGSARIMGGSKLRDWFQAHYSPGDVIDVDLSSFDSIRIDGTGRGIDRGLLTPTPRSATQRADKEVTADELARWRRGLVCVGQPLSWRHSRSRWCGFVGRFLHGSPVHPAYHPARSLAAGQHPDLFSSSQLYPECPSIPLYDHIARSIAERCTVFCSRVSGQ